MKTAEEIYARVWKDHPDWGQRAISIEAMEMYANEKAVEFAQWVDINAYEMVDKLGTNLSHSDLLFIFNKEKLINDLVDKAFKPQNL